MAINFFYLGAISYMHVQNFMLMQLIFFILVQYLRMQVQHRHILEQLVIEPSTTLQVQLLYMQMQHYILI